MEFFFANHFKNWLFLGTAYGKFPRMAAELALSGGKQRRQNVRVNFPYAVLRNSAIFSKQPADRPPARLAIQAYLFQFHGINQFFYDMNIAQMDSLQLKIQAAMRGAVSDDSDPLAYLFNRFVNYPLSKANGLPASSTS